jgi:inorganic pyrophosphatase
MTIPLNELPAVDPDSGRLNVVIDSPRGSRNKYKFDESSGQWRLSKILPQGMSFPYDFGFIPSTEGEDGDPVDVLLLSDEPAFPGCVVPARLIGVLEAEQVEGDRTTRKWRKQAKYLRYQLEVLHPLWLERMEELANEADQMSELLGDDHDLAVLRQRLGEDPGQYGHEDDTAVLLALIDRRRAELRDEVMPLGRLFFQDIPQDFAQRLKGFWKTWRTTVGAT